MRLAMIGIVAAATLLGAHAASAGAASGLAAAGGLERDHAADIEKAHWRRKRHYSYRYWPRVYRYSYRPYYYYYAPRRYYRYWW